MPKLWMENRDTPENIGKHFLYNHQSFCSKECIEEAKRNPHTLICNVKPSDCDEQGCPNLIENWKMKRKSIREKRKK